MKVIVDTSVWSLALRRRRGGKRSAEALELENMVRDYRVRMLGPIRQEILSGIREETQFREIESVLRSFRDTPIRTEDYVQAAAFFNQCRKKGVQGSNTDFLICAVAARTGSLIFTTDRDFQRYARHLPIGLYEASGTGSALQ